MMATQKICRSCGRRQVRTRVGDGFVVCVVVEVAPLGGAGDRGAREENAQALRQPHGLKPLELVVVVLTAVH
eukprot:4478670-Prymnesium_polylepis.1